MSDNGLQHGRSDTSYLGSELGFTDVLGGYSIGSFNDTAQGTTDGDAYYGSVIASLYVLVVDASSHVSFICPNPTWFLSFSFCKYRR